MSDKTQPDTLHELMPCIRDTKKGSPPGGHEAVDRLRARQMKHVAVGRKLPSASAVPAPASH